MPLRFDSPWPRQRAEIFQKADCRSSSAQEVSAQEAPLNILPCLLTLLPAGWLEGTPCLPGKVGMYSMSSVGQALRK